MFSKLKKASIQAIAVLVFGIAFCCQATFSQQTLGSIAGTVTDTSGSTIADANVTATQDSHPTRSNGNHKLQRLL